VGLTIDLGMGLDNPREDGILTTMLKRDEVVLSGRQVSVLKMRMEGRSYTEIARELDITASRVGQIVATLRKKGLKA
jgi:transcriptional regulator